MKNKVALLIKPERFEIETHKIDKLEKDYVLVKIHKLCMWIRFALF